MFRIAGAVKLVSYAVLAVQLESCNYCNKMIDASYKELFIPSEPFTMVELRLKLDIGLVAHDCRMQGDYMWWVNTATDHDNPVYMKSHTRRKQ